MRAVFFGSGSPMSTRALLALRARPELELVAVVVPAAAPGAPWRRRLRRWRARRPLAVLARRWRLPVLAFHPRAAEAFLPRLRGLAADLACVSTFPHLLPPAVLGATRLGALGLHPSQLPRHRGPDPLYWAYFAGEPETGVSVIWLDAGEDTGDVVAQEAIAIPRGRSGAALYLEMADRGAALLATAAEAVAGGRATRTPQDEGRATREPAPSAATVRVDPAAWGAEALWHFLGGVGVSRAFLAGPDGRPLVGRTVSWSKGTSAAPGAIAAVPGGWRIHTRDGSVDVVA